ncbi:MAG: hypothetical protein ETSY2_36135 [Candidatus Entotheonella gemina]|uniref:Uncharacterized protein n=1 Tax=Candidatus Entotheonella gemina TaxID=1429439 RepID=W4LWL4_9BACT|nr:MAG: hypothetical protein ETSY2_36135 [Candidatus Entotheonella gemina]
MIERTTLIRELNARRETPSLLQLVVRSLVPILGLILIVGTVLWGVWVSLAVFVLVTILFESYLA